MIRLSILVQGGACRRRVGPVSDDSRKRRAGVRPPAGPPRRAAGSIEAFCGVVRCTSELVRQPHFVTFAAFPLVKAVYLLKS